MTSAMLDKQFLVHGCVNTLTDHWQQPITARVTFTTLHKTQLLHSCGVNQFLIATYHQG